MSVFSITNTQANFSDQHNNCEFSHIDSNPILYSLTSFNAREWTAILGQIIILTATYFEIKNNFFNNLSTFIGMSFYVFSPESNNGPPQSL